MDMAHILIVALGAACLVVMGLIITVLRRPTPARRIRKGAEDEQTLARVFAVPPLPPAPSLSPVAPTSTPDEPVLTMPYLSEDPAPLGRMPGLPVAQHNPIAHGQPVPGARIPPGPLPFERLPSPTGWENSSITPLARPDMSEHALPARAPGSGSLSRDAFAASTSSLEVPFTGRRSDAHLGRMPGFAPADQSSPAGSSPLPNLNGERRLGVLTRLYAENIQVAYDSPLDAVDIVFTACPIHSPAEVAQAFRVLLAKVHTALKPLSRDRAALLVDVAGLDLSANLTLVWGSSLKAFLAAACEQIGPDRYLIARYNSHAPTLGSRQEAIQRIQSVAPAVAQGLQNNILGSRDEAAALLARLRELATLPDF